MNLINTPFNYTGNKFKLLEQLLPEFDYSRNNFVDLFCGGGSIYTNIVDKYNNIIINDIIKDLIDIHKLLIFNTNDFINNVKKIIPSCDNKEEYLKLRNSYNKEKTPEKLYALMLTCTNNMIRFNKRFDFNQTFGKRSWNDQINKKVNNFINHIFPYKDNLTYLSESFENIKIPNNSMVYIDPPYFNTNAGYNTYWNILNEKKLYDFIININNMNISFAISGVLSHNGIESNLLKNLIKDGFNYKELNCNYNKISKLKKEKNTIEIILKNF